MKIRYEIQFDEPISIDGTWPLELPGGGTLTILTENSKATGLRLEFSGKPSDHLRVKDGVIHVDDKRWIEMRWFFARLKSYIQCVTDVDFDPTEVYVHYDGETEDEKQQIPFHKLVVEKTPLRGGKQVLDHELLAAAALGSCKNQNAAPYYIGDLKTLSRRSAWQRRYVDSFRFGFLIIETLYGDGQFKSNKLAEALKSQHKFMQVLETARYDVRRTIERARDETEEIICSDRPTGDIVDHIIKKRGYYFHGNEKMIHDASWIIEKEKTLCALLSKATDIICFELTKYLYDDESWREYEKHARNSGMETNMLVEGTFWCIPKKEKVIIRQFSQLIGDKNSRRMRVKWALHALQELEYSHEIFRLNVLECKVDETDQMLFRIDVGDTESDPMSQVSEEQKNDSTTKQVYLVNFVFAEENEELQYKFDGNDKMDGPELDNVRIKEVLIESLKSSRLYNHGELRRIDCERLESGEKVFNIDLECFDGGRKIAKC